MDSAEPEGCPLAVPLLCWSEGVEGSSDVHPVPEARFEAAGCGNAAGLAALSPLER